MKFRIIILIVLFIIGLPRNICAQCGIDISGWSNDAFKISVETKPKGSAEISTVKKGEILVVFKEKFNDSVIVCLNNKQVKKGYVVSDTVSVLGSSNLFFKFSRESNKKQHLYILLPESKSYIKVPLKKNYKMMNVTRLNTFWIINFRNHINTYE